ncbi:MAG: S49 family peptidase [Betaproteobacteria bacterium]|nr:S49 family peptidase [Betaproteobacteria bacterium]MDE2047202.1 S49 family peptidase [Betaproteobacteria bacterium]
MSSEKNRPETAGEPAPSQASIAPQGREQAAQWERSVLERLAFATLDEQRRARRWRIFFRIAFVLLLAVIAAGVWRPSVDLQDVSGPHTALVELQGEIAADTLASADNINDALRAAFDDPDSKAVVLRINSPGGSPVQAGIINDEIWRLKKLYRKPIYVVVDDLCASGGYYVAAAADRIYVDKASLVGSIGVLMDGFGFTGLMSKLGVERRLYTAGKNKGFLDPFSPQSKPQEDYARQMLEEVHQQFIAVVKKGRGKRLKLSDPDLFSGLVFNGDRSIALGLADGHGTLDSVARDVVKAEKVVDYTVKENVLDRISRRFGTTAGAAIASAMRNMSMR